MERTTRSRRIELEPKAWFQRRGRLVALRRSLAGRLLNRPGSAQNSSVAWIRCSIKYLNARKFKLGRICDLIADQTIYPANCNMSCHIESKNGD